MNVVKVRLRKPRRVFSFLCSDLALKRDEPCVVLSDRGEEFGTCILPPEPCPRDMEKRFSMKVVRTLTDKDTRNCSYLEEEEARAREICLKKIKASRLPMKLVDVEVTFDKRKIIFYFTADDRVDFRELVRELAHDLRARIEMRHIQVRDEAKMVGGLGGCGRELCCSSWMNEFRPISMRMAKAQNLSLNPSKISGQCGRLLCCLSYENEQYEALRKKARADAKARESKALAQPEPKVAEEKAPVRDAKRGGEVRSESKGPKPDVAPSQGARRRTRSDAPETRALPDTPVAAPSPPRTASTSPEAQKAEDDDAKAQRRRPRRNRKRKRGPRPEKSDGAPS